jgi:hypothetical protein
MFRIRNVYPGSGMFIPDPYPDFFPSQIQQQQKRGWEKPKKFVALPVLRDSLLSAYIIFSELKCGAEGARAIL